MLRSLVLLCGLAAPVVAQRVDTVYVVVPVVVNVPADSAQMASFHQQQLAIRFHMLAKCREGLEREAAALARCQMRVDSLTKLLADRGITKAEMPVGVFALFVLLFLVAGWLIKRGRQ